MCFSAEVSYGSAALLVVTGAVTTFKNPLREQKMIAAIPILFGVQQAAEGVVWQTLGGESSASWHQLASLLFVSVAFVIWPSWLPWSLYRIERSGQRKRILKVIAVMGSAVSLLAVSVLFTAEIKAAPVGHSLEYAFRNFQRWWPAQIDFLLYDIPTLVPFFVSSLRTVRNAGYLVFGSMILASVINKEASTSVWCFFAALISFYIAANILWRRTAEIH